MNELLEHYVKLYRESVQLKAELVCLVADLDKAREALEEVNKLFYADMSIDYDYASEKMCQAHEVTRRALAELEGKLELIG